MHPLMPGVSGSPGRNCRFELSVMDSRHRRAKDAVFRTAMRGMSGGRSFLLHQQRHRQRAEADEGDHRIHRVRHFPLPAQLLPVGRNLGPVVGRLVGRKGEGEENDKVGDEADRGRSAQRQSALPAHRPGERKIGEERAEQHDAEQRPAAIDVLHDEIIALGQSRSCSAARRNARRREPAPAPSERLQEI